MKKLVLGLLAAFLMSAGLVAVAGTTPAQAVCGNPQYPACFNTTATLTVSPSGTGGPNRTFTVRVKGVGTNATPVGKVTFRFQVSGVSGVRTATYALRNGRASFSKQLYKAGRWNVSATYYAQEDTIFRSDATNRVAFTVVTNGR